MITITEGTSSQVFYISRTVLGKYAPSLLAENSFPKSGSRWWTEDVDIATFVLFAGWIENLGFSNLEKALSHIGNSSDKALFLIKLYIFGSRHDITKLKFGALVELGSFLSNDLPAELAAHELFGTQIDVDLGGKCLIGTREINLVYEYTEVGDPLRRLLVYVVFAQEFPFKIFAMYPAGFGADGGRWIGVLESTGLPIEERNAWATREMISEVRQWKLAS